MGLNTAMQLLFSISMQELLHLIIALFEEEQNSLEQKARSSHLQSTPTILSQ